MIFILSLNWNIWLPIILFNVVVCCCWWCTLNVFPCFFVSGGLLHSIPSTEEKSDVESYINSALKECVYETSNGARDTAVNNLSDILFTFMKHLA